MPQLTDRLSRIHDLLTEAFQPVELEISDDSAKHAGPPRVRSYDRVCGGRSIAGAIVRAVFRQDPDCGATVDDHAAGGVDPVGVPGGVDFHVIGRASGEGNVAGDIEGADGIARRDRAAGTRGQSANFA